MPKGSKSITVDTISVDHSVKLRNNSLTLAPKNDVLYVVDDVQVSAEKIRVLSPNKIKSINILKDQSATDKYGAKGKEGVIEIVTKEKETRSEERRVGKKCVSKCKSRRSP